MKRLKITRGTSIAMILLLSVGAAVPFTAAFAPILFVHTAETSRAAGTRTSIMPLGKEDEEKQVKTGQHPVVVGGSLNGNPERAVDLPRFGWRQ